ncbi:MAG: DUF4118 domain-containing protein [Hungatella sp.]
MSKANITRNTAITLLFLMIATIISVLFFITTKNTTTIAIIYMLAILLIARRTDGYIPGIIASFIGVIMINFIFTYPYMQLNFKLAGYPITFLGMMVISIITSTLTTHLKEQTKVLNERERLLMEAEKEIMRANLLRAISHDLRTPLAGIIGSSSAYLEHGSHMLPEERNHLVETISEDANWLLQMVENLLSITRISSEDAHVVTTLEPLEEIIPDAVMRFHKRLPEASVHVHIPEEFIMIPMDATLIEQVLLNLLENAVYHSDSLLPIDLSVTMIEESAQFSIRDYGRGIRSDRLETLFDGYTTTSNQSSDSHKGMGIGLSICKTIIHAHHGEIYATNHEQGAEFIFTLPIGDEIYEP